MYKEESKGSYFDQVISLERFQQCDMFMEVLFGKF